MKLEVGMYVRYKYENCIYIGKIKFISEVMCGLDETLQIDIDNCMEEILKRDVIKASHNIIDLIEVGDYVNGSKVEQIDFGLNDDRVQVITAECYVGQENFEYDVITANEIKSIVTKEMFESMEYKVNE